MKLPELILKHLEDEFNSITHSELYSACYIAWNYASDSGYSKPGSNSWMTMFTDKLLEELKK